MIPAKFAIGVRVPQRSACKRLLRCIAKAIRCSRAATRLLSTPLEFAVSAIGDDWKDFLAALAANRVEYMLVGGIALGVHGHVRYTRDMDVWYRATIGNAQRLISALREFGFADIHVAAEEFCKPRAMLVLGAEPNSIELLNFADGVEFDACFENRILVSLAGVEVSVIGLDDLRKNKRAVGRLQDLADIERLEDTTEDE